MKKHILKIGNYIFGLFGAKIISDTSDSFSMSDAVKRIVDHNIEIRSIIDIGASNGIWSVNAMKTFPNTTILAVEPLRERFSDLQTLKAKNKNFDYEPCAIGNSMLDQVLINVSNDLDGSTIGGAGGIPRHVKQKTIDHIISEKMIAGPFLLKFDTHGYELPILEGAKETLKNTNIIIMEVYNFQITKSTLLFYEMCTRMEELGFRCYDMADPMLRIYDKSFWQMDIFFCRNDAKLFSHEGYR